MLRRKLIRDGLVSDEMLARMTGYLSLDAAEASARLEEFLKFAIISLNTPAETRRARFIPIVTAVDQVWHFLLLQTRQYAALCEAIAPGRFLHHETFSYDSHIAEVSSVEQLMQEDLSWIASYVHSFGGFDDQTVRFWRVPLTLMNQLGWRVERVNELGHQLISKAVAAAQ